jgi:hypothetical protein
VQKNRKFVNPLTRPTEKTPEEPPTSTSTDTFTDTSTSTPDKEQPHKRKERTFEQIHERITLWIDKRLKRKFEALASRERIPKTTLLNEAITDLLEKYQDR